MKLDNYENVMCPCGVQMSIEYMDFRKENKHLEIALKCQNCGITEVHDYELTDKHRKVVSDE